MWVGWRWFAGSLSPLLPTTGVPCGRGTLPRRWVAWAQQQGRLARLRDYSCCLTPFCGGDDRLTRYHFLARPNVVLCLGASMAIIRRVYRRNENRRLLHDGDLPTGLTDYFA